jgi:hypothetical protein
LLLLTLPACGLGDYEELMREAQERERRFQDEKKYLDEPVKVPTKKDGDREIPVAEIFFRPPKGIRATFETTPRNNLLWRYPARTSGGDFALVEMAFGEDNKDFAAEVVRNYQASEPIRPRAQQFNVPGRDSSLVFDIWEFESGQEGFSINVLRDPRRPVAVVYVYNKARRDSARKAIELSLESLAVGPQVRAARQQYDRKSPWQLKSTAPR